MAIHVKSEIGKLKKVMLHRPGQELEHLVPEDLERLLFDDIPYLKTAKIEHDMFAEIMQGQGVYCRGWCFCNKSEGAVIRISDEYCRRKGTCVKDDVRNPGF